MKSIKETFLSRSQWVNNRASAVFPCYINDKNDQVITFQNYWLWKGKISELDIFITLIDGNSSFKMKKRVSVTEHNEIFIKKLFKIEKFEGLINFEVLSKHNLRFAFPAIYCFYLNNNGLISCVHSGGRILNDNEVNNSSNFNETNFLCKLDNNFEPFFHIFKGPIKEKGKKLIELEVKNKKNKKLFKVKKYVELKKPYSSKIYFLSNFLKNRELKKLYKKEFFLIIRHSEKNIFGRLVAGNYDKKNDALFTTHTLNSYQNKNFDDKISPIKNYSSNIFLSLMSDRNLQLETRVYPTNQDFKIKFDIKKINPVNKPLKKIKLKENIQSGSRGEIFTKKILNRNLTLLYTNKKVPGRIYVSHNYSFKGCRHPTDMGLSFNNTNMPEKRVHWGQLFIKKGTKSILFIRNISHKKENLNNPSKCTLEFFNNSFSKKKKFKINKNSFKILNFNNNLNKINSDFISWKLFANEGNLEVVWLSLNKQKGSICGDHSF